MFAYLSPESMVPEDHPLRPIRKMVDAALIPLAKRLSGLYSDLGRPSVPPEKLLRALLLQALYSIRSEALLVEQLRYNFLFRWFVGLGAEDKVWDATVFSKNRDRLIEGDVAQAFFEAVLVRAAEEKLLSDEHFTVDGTLLEAWASKKSYQPKQQPPEEGSGSRGEVLRRDTHESKTDADAQLYRKGGGAEYQLCHMAHLLIENRNGLAVAACVTRPSPEEERQAAIDMLEGFPRAPHATLGADKSYDDAQLIAQLRAMNVTPHVAQYAGRKSHIDGRTTRHEGYAVSLRQRKRIEHIFGWVKNTALLRKVRHRGHARVEWMFKLALTAYNLVRLRTLAVAAA